MSFSNTTTHPHFAPNTGHRDGLAIAGLLSRHTKTAKATAAATDIDLSGMTAAQLREALRQFLDSPPAKEGGRAM